MQATLRCCVLLLPLLSSSPTLAAKDISPKELDMACAITRVAEMRADPDNRENQTTAATLWVFYLGRLSALDDVTDWNKVVSDHVAEMGDKARSRDLFAACMDFFSSKIK